MISECISQKIVPKKLQHFGAKTNLSLVQTFQPLAGVNEKEK
jgi:hypothetical protein